LSKLFNLTYWWFLKIVLITEICEQGGTTFQICQKQPKTTSRYFTHVKFQHSKPLSIIPFCILYLLSGLRFTKLLCKSFILKQTFSLEKCQSQTKIDELLC
jgi:hypothetical protein